MVLKPAPNKAGQPTSTSPLAGPPRAHGPGGDLVEATQFRMTCTNRHSNCLTVSDAMSGNQAIMMVRRRMADLKPSVFDAPLRGCCYPGTFNGTGA
jgi:hypothetical protein